MKFTFLHCADLHLGSPMRGLALKDEKVAEKFAAASRDAFGDLVRRAIEERAAFVLIAGDLYDGDWRDNSVGLFFSGRMAELARSHIPVFLVRGNHDAASLITKTIALPDNVTTFATERPETATIDELRVAIHGRSFPDRVVDENWAIAYPAPRAGWFNIGLLHTSVENTKHAAYAPCSVADLTARGYDYWALGHVHDFQILSRDPWIVFPGNLQGRHIRETGAKGAVFVDVEDGRVANVRREIVDRARWIDAEVDVSAEATLSDVHNAIGNALRGPLADAAGRLAAARIGLVGATPLHRALKSARAQIADDAQSIACELHGDVWIEKLLVETTEPESGRPPLELSGLDLDAMMAECAADPQTRRRAAEAIAQIVAKIPGSAHSDTPGLAEDIDALIADARAIALARADSGGGRP